MLIAVATRCYLMLQVRYKVRYKVRYTVAYCSKYTGSLTYAHLIAVTGVATPDQRKCRVLLGGRPQFMSTPFYASVCGLALAYQLV
jgi:hypothetical protein